jgi:hypothetical protein
MVSEDISSVSITTIDPVTEVPTLVVVGLNPAGPSHAENSATSLQALGDNIAETNRKSEYATGFRLIEMNTNNYFLGGHPAVRVVYVASVNESEVKGTIVNGKEYGLVSTADNEFYSDYSDIFQHMLDTFQIIETNLVFDLSI